MSKNTPGVYVKVVAENAAKPVTLIITGNSAMCSCGWMGHPPLVCLLGEDRRRNTPAGDRARG
jgi:hypothetical protein